MYHTGASTKEPETFFQNKPTMFMLFIPSIKAMPPQQCDIVV